MTSAEYREYIASPQWQQRRKAFLTPWAFCLKCWMPRWLAKIAYGQDLHVHHLSYGRIGAETDHDLSALCRRCHDIETFGRSDLIAPPSHDCATCNLAHWNPYSDDCDACLNIKIGGFGCRDALLEAAVAPVRRTVWEDAVLNICISRGVDAVLDCIGELESDLRQHHEWHLELKAQMAREAAECQSE